MATPNYVKFQRGTNAAYQNLKTLNKLDNDTLYFTYDSIDDDTGSLYLGDKMICDNASTTTYGIADLDDVTLGDDLSNNHILIYNGANWINVNSSTLLSNVYTKSEVDAKIAAIPSSGSGGGLSYKLAESVSAIDLTAADAAQYIYFVPHSSSTNDAYDEYMVISGALEKIGTLSVDLTDYITATELTNYLSNYVEKEDGSRLITQVEVAKLEGIEAGAEKNIIQSVEPGEFSIDADRKLSLNAVPASKISGLSDAIANGQFIKSVDVGNFSVDETGKLELASISTDQISGYATDGPRLINAEEIYKLSQLDLSGNAFVPTVLYHAEIGDLSSLTNYDEDNPTTIVDEINTLNECLTWGNISAT